MDFSKQYVPVSPKKVFVGGSKSFEALDKETKNKIDGYIAENVRILIGDCRGTDKLVQAYLFLKGYRNVTVYATDGKARNNIGDWAVKNVPSHGEKGYEYYRLKDIEMAKDADEAFMIWDGKSRGTAFNCEEMRDLEKKVYIHQPKEDEGFEKNGVFWLIDDKICAFPYDSEIYREAISKSGNTYNHEKIWEYIRPKGCNKPYNYYPRGRVVIASGRGPLLRYNRNPVTAMNYSPEPTLPVVYMNQNIDKKYIPEIIKLFNLHSPPVVRYDFSEHYKCCLDE